MGRPPRITREQILAAARGAFATRGFAGTTLADVAGELHVTPAAILRHFASKQELFGAAMTGPDAVLPAAIEELARADAADDPRVVLRRFGEQFVPFVQSVIGAVIAVHMHVRAPQTTVVVPFDTTAEETPPRRGLRVVTDYFRRAMDAGKIRRGNPRAAALLFVGQLQSYVFIHNVLNVVPVFPLDQYLDALLDLWTNGAIEVGGTRARTKKSSAPDRDRSRVARGSGGGAAVRPRAAKAEAPRPRRNAGGEDGERRIARRRTRDPRPRR